MRTQRTIGVEALVRIPIAATQSVFSCFAPAPPTVHVCAPRRSLDTTRALRVVLDTLKKLNRVLGCIMVFFLYGL